jgi:hypothetical protein
MPLVILSDSETLMRQQANVPLERLLNNFTTTPSNLKVPLQRVYAAIVIMSSPIVFCSIPNYWVDRCFHAHISNVK